MWDIRSIFLLIFLLPGVALAQTVHVEKDKIVYTGKLEVGAKNKRNLSNKVKQVLWNYVNKEMDSIKEDKEKNLWSANGQMNLPSPHHLIKTLGYSVKISLNDSDPKYEIDKVYLKLQERGGNAKIISSEQLLKGMETSGLVSMQTEKQLNEIDMHLQKLIALMKRDMKNL